MPRTITEDTVLLLAPPETDTSRPERLMEQAGLTWQRCADVAELARLAPQAGCAVLYEKSLDEVDTGPLRAMLNGQPPWSNFPFLMLVARGHDNADEDRLDHLEEYGNVFFLEMPCRDVVFTGNVKSVLDGRRRQYGVREQLAELAENDRHLATGTERRRLLVRELHHRVKNTLATVQALMSSTARSAQTVEEFRQSLLGRISALSHVHEVLTEDKWQEAPLRALFASQLEPEHGPDFKGEAVLEGPEIKLPSHLAVPLGLAIHELTTNALKYGALSTEGGKVTASWSIEKDNAQEALRIDWRETGGPPIPVPRRRGFGTQFLERALRQQAAADIDLSYHPAGLHASLRIPLPERTHFHLFADS